MDKVVRQVRVILNRRQLYSRCTLTNFLRECPLEARGDVAPDLAGVASFLGADPEGGLRQFYLALSAFDSDVTLAQDLANAWAPPPDPGIRAVIYRIATEGRLQWASFHGLVRDKFIDGRDSEAVQGLCTFFHFYKDAMWEALEDAKPVRFAMDRDSKSTWLTTGANGADIPGGTKTRHGPKPGDERSLAGASAQPLQNKHRSILLDRSEYSGKINV